ncbi:MAG: hypothetical protein VXY93_11925, partial [Pseudomonadota bacterium]|nr:hypothetical protein [Pseudomonadota bacterium]
MVKMNTSSGFAGALYGVGNSVIALLRANLQWGVKVNSGSSTELYHTGNAKKLETTTTGITVTGDITGTGDLTLTSTDSGAAAAPIIDLVRNSSSAADNDLLGQLRFSGKDDQGSAETYAYITGKILDASAGGEDGILEFTHRKNSAYVITGRWRSDSLQLLNSTNFSVAGTSEFTGAATFNGSINSNAALNIAAGTQITLATGQWAGDVYGKIQHHANRLYLGAGSNADPSFVIRYSGNDRIYMTSGGTFYPT